MTTPMNVSNETQRYTNPDTDIPYKYARPFRLKRKMSNTVKFTSDSNTSITVRLKGVPDGVSPLATEAIVEKDLPLRLYIYSPQPLKSEQIEFLEKLVDKTPYPIFQVVHPSARLSHIPKNNFYLCQGVPNIISTFTEYRYLQRRHEISNIAYDVKTAFVYPLVLPHTPQIVLIMPKNFKRTGLRCGYFEFPNNLIIRLYSAHMLSASTIGFENDPGIVSVISTENQYLITIIKTFFCRMGMHRIMSNALNQIYASDKYLTLIVGSTANILLP
ncbi:GbNV_gp35-like [Fopius arisanus]|nr:GbNV_gp35-like [Fopius arisanus]